MAEGMMEYTDLQRTADLENLRKWLDDIDPSENLKETFNSFVANGSDDLKGSTVLEQFKAYRDQDVVNAQLVALNIEGDLFDKIEEKLANPKVSPTEPGLKAEVEGKNPPNSAENADPAPSGKTGEPSVTQSEATKPADKRDLEENQARMAAEAGRQDHQQQGGGQTRADPVDLGAVGGAIWGAKELIAGGYNAVKALGRDGYGAAKAVGRDLFNKNGAGMAPHPGGADLAHESTASPQAPEQAKVRSFEDKSVAVDASLDGLSDAVDHFVGLGASASGPEKTAALTKMGEAKDNLLDTLHTEFQAGLDQVKSRNMTPSGLQDLADKRVEKMEGLFDKAANSDTANADKDSKDKVEEMKKSAMDKVREMVEKMMTMLKNLFKGNTAGPKGP